MPKIWIIKKRDSDKNEDEEKGGYYRLTANGLWQPVSDINHATTYDDFDEACEARDDCIAKTGVDVIGMVWTQKAKATWETME